jgi:hypothetical protein
MYAAVPESPMYPKISQFRAVEYAHGRSDQQEVSLFVQRRRRRLQDTPNWTSIPHSPYGLGNLCQCRASCFLMVPEAGGGFLLESNSVAPIRGHNCASAQRDREGPGRDIYLFLGREIHTFNISIAASCTWLVLQKLELASQRVPPLHLMRRFLQRTHLHVKTSLRRYSYAARTRLRASFATLGRLLGCAFEANGCSPMVFRPPRPELNAGWSIIIAKTIAPTAAETQINATSLYM